MRLISLVSLTMVAFAANSVLGRLAIGGSYMEANLFGLLRLLSGAGVLLLLCRLQNVALPWAPVQTLWGGGALTLYIVGFSMAYQDLDAGLGALILFGVVQVAMFGWGAMRGAVVSAGQIAGAVLALMGLAIVVWPTSDAVVAPFTATVLMTLAGIGWAAYSLLGRSATAPLATTAINFAAATVIMLPLSFVLATDVVVSVEGVLLALLSGAVTSGLGYALWYAVLPALSAAVAATVQLSVPVLAILAGALLLGEDIGLRLALGSVAVLGGIAVVIRLAPPKPKPVSPEAMVKR
ncbi:DMT family transporter [Phaeobacter sp.]|uniref:DMT family transporter n=1 Tax=Phaeobacter sp. TaxID=1902409 RepID=UPI0025D7F15A|nr:DMT family transporter [Phaeobacter sp.]